MPFTLSSFFSVLYAVFIFFFSLLFSLALTCDHFVLILFSVLVILLLSLFFEVFISLSLQWGLCSFELSATHVRVHFVWESSKSTENGRGFSVVDVWEVSLVKECFSLG